MLGRAKKWARKVLQLVGLEYTSKPEIEVPRAFLGTSYGGWWVSLPGLNAQSVVYSAGVGNDISFDSALIQKLGCQVHAFDPTPRSLQWVNSSEEVKKLGDRFRFHPVGFADFDGEASFQAPEEESHVSFSMAKSGGGVKAPVRRLSTIMRDLSHRGIDLLKMDIEGAEYDVIDDLLDQDVLVKQLLVELHGTRWGGARRVRQVMDRLRSKGYRVFAVSHTGNEYSLIRVN